MTAPALVYVARSPSDMYMIEPEMISGEASTA